MTGPRDMGGGRGGGTNLGVSATSDIDRIGLGGVQKSIAALMGHIARAKDMLGMPVVPSEEAKSLSAPKEVGVLAFDMKTRCAIMQATVDHATVSMESILAELGKLSELIES